MSRLKLKPCVSCKEGRALTHSTIAPLNKAPVGVSPESVRYYLSCNWCSFVAPKFRTLEEAIKAWNERTPSPQTEGGRG